MQLKDKKDGLMCQVCATMDMLRWAKSSVIIEAENYDFTVQRFLKCQVTLLLLWICSVGSSTSIVRVITVLKISFWYYSYFREVDVLPTSSNLDHRRKGGGGGGGGGGWESDFFVLWSDFLMKSSTSYRNVHSDNAKKWKMKTRVCV